MTIPESVTLSATDYDAVIDAWHGPRMVDNRNWDVMKSICARNPRLFGFQKLADAAP